MDKNKVISDKKFMLRQSEYGTQWLDFETYDNIIIMNTHKNGVYIILDKKYNIIGIHKVEFANMHLTMEDIAKKYNELYSLVDKDLSCNFLYPFENLSLKQIIEL